MKLKEIVMFLDEKIPQSLALDFDEVGFKKEYNLNQNISSIKIYMDLLPKDDKNYEETLIITHHPPSFIPKTPTYIIHSNWDIIDGGANDALAEKLDLEVIDYLDSDTHIGRVCRTDMKFIRLKENIMKNFKNTRIATNLDNDSLIKRIGIISGFGLKNPDYIKLSKSKNIDVLISGDLTHESAILAKNIGITLIDLGHHESEFPSLYALANILEELEINIEVINQKPIENLNME